MAYDKAQQFLNDKGQRPTGIKLDASGYINKNNTAMNNYQTSAQGGFDKYKGQMGQNIGLMKQNVQNQINALNQQLANNKTKYQMMADEQTNAINKNYKKQNEEIDQMTFNQYKMANQMGAQRGVSSSAQQQAMDNHVGQASAALFNENSTNRQDGLNTLQNKLMQGYIDLDNQYSKDLTGIQTNALNQYMQHNTAMAGKELEFATTMADKVLNMQLKNNEIEFKTKAEEEKYRAELEKMIYQMQFQNYGAMDNRNFQGDENQKNRDFQASEAEKNRAFQASEAEKDRAFRAQQSALNRVTSGKSGTTKQEKEDDEMARAMMQYYMDAGYNPMQAKDLALQSLQRKQAGNSSGKMPSVTQFSGYSQFAPEPKKELPRYEITSDMQAILDKMNGKRKGR